MKITDLSNQELQLTTGGGCGIWEKIKYFVDDLFDDGNPWNNSNMPCPRG